MECDKNKVGEGREGKKYFPKIINELKKKFTKPIQRGKKNHLVPKFDFI